MKITDRPKQKTLIIVVAALVCLALAVGGTFAAYMSQSYQKGVVRNKDNEAIRFTSNYMQPASMNAEEKDYSSRIIRYSSDSVSEKSLVIDIYVYNYVVGNASLVNENDVVYNMNIKLTGGVSTSYVVNKVVGEQKISLTEQTGAEPEYIMENVTLTGRTPQSDHYTVTISGADIDKLKIIATATPLTPSFTGNKKLAAVISPSSEAKMQEFTCVGTFTDSGSGLSPNTYDAFNYEVTISSGKANVMLTWQPDKVEIDKFFLEKLTENGGTYDYNPTDGTLTFVMNVADGTGDYLIPFYRKSTSEKLPEHWPAMKEVIKVRGTQIDGE